MLTDANLDRMIDAFEEGRTGIPTKSRAATIWASVSDARVLRQARRDGQNLAWSDRFMPRRTRVSFSPAY